jgi:hypothetical protein
VSFSPHTAPLTQRPVQGRLASRLTHTHTHTHTHQHPGSHSHLKPLFVFLLSPHSAKWPQPWNTLLLYLITNPLSSNLILIFGCLICVYVYKACQKLEIITALVTVKDVLPVKCTRWRGFWRPRGAWKH